MFLLSLEVGDEQLDLYNICQEMVWAHYKMRNFITKYNSNFKSFELYYKQLEAYNKL
jgi:hypothetical protein